MWAGKVHDSLLQKDKFWFFASIYPDQNVFHNSVYNISAEYKGKLIKCNGIVVHLDTVQG